MPEKSFSQLGMLPIIKTNNMISTSPQYLTIMLPGKFMLEFWKLSRNKTTKTTLQDTMLHRYRVLAEKLHFHPRIRRKILTG